MPAERINYTDTLRIGTDKINGAIDAANLAESVSASADTKATTALSNSESTQTQLDTIVINGDSSVEAAQARVDATGTTTYTTLKARLDAENQNLTAQLDENEWQIKKNKEYAEKRAIVLNQIANPNYFAAVQGNKVYIVNYRSLLSSTDDGKTTTLVHNFNSYPNIRQVMQNLLILDSGAMLLRIQLLDETYSLVRSGDNGATWSTVIPQLPDIMRYSMVQTTDGRVYIASYDTFDGRILRSDDDGVTFLVASTINDVRHFHFIMEDPYNPNTLYAGSGDQDAESKIIVSSNYGVSWTTLGGGTQLWRAVGLLFTDDYIYWGMDSTFANQPCYIVRCNRTTKQVEYLQAVNAPIYYCHKTAKGELLFASMPEAQAATVDTNNNIYYSNDGETFTIVFTFYNTQKGYNILYFVGENANKLYLNLYTLDYGNLGMVAYITDGKAVFPNAPVGPTKLYYNMDANNKSIVNIASIVPQLYVNMDINGNQSKVRIGNGSVHNATELFYRAFLKAQVTTLGLEIIPNGDGILMRSANGTRYKIYAKDDGTVGIVPFA